jgi:hypothetical protein
MLVVRIAERLPIRIAVFAAIVLSSTAFAGSARIQCWTDDQGHRACGNAVPTQYANKEREVFNARGRVVETKSGVSSKDADAPESKLENPEVKAPAPAIAH